MLITID